MLQSSGSAARSACFPVLVIEVQTCNEQKHRTWLEHVSSRIDLSIKETLLVKRRWIQMQRKTVRKMDL